MALLALFVALSGGAYAAFRLPKASVGSAQLARGSVSEAKLRDGAVTARKVKAGTLLAKDFKPGQLPPGATGPQGAQGPRGATGPAGGAGGAAGGALAGTYPNPSIAAGAVGTGQLLDRSVTGTKVAPGSLTGANIDSSTLGLVPSAESAEFIENPSSAGIEQGEGRTITESGIVESGPLGASNGRDVFQLDEARVLIVCGHEHPTIHNNVAVELEDVNAAPITAWVNATTTNATFSGLKTYEYGKNEFREIGLSAEPQQFVIQARSTHVTFTTLLSTDYKAAAGAGSSAQCEWSATTTIVPGQ